MINKLYTIKGNTFYTDRYVKFINSRKQSTEIFETHHILPKSLFPEYSDLVLYPNNGIKLSPREHYIAHYILAKAFGGKLLYAFNMMRCNSPTNNRDYRISSHVYEYLKREMGNNNPAKDIDARKKISEKLKIRWSTQEHRDLMKQINSCPDTFNRRSISMKEVWDDEKRAKHSDHIKFLWATEEYRNTVTEKLKDVWKCDAYRRKMSNITKEKWATDDEYRKMMCERMKGENNPFYGKKHTEETKEKIRNAIKNNPINYNHTEETKRILSIKSKERFKDPEYKKMMVDSRKNRNHSQETKDTISKKAKERAKSPEYRKKMSEAQKNRKRGICIHCNIEMDICNLKKYHMDNCKYKK